MAGQPSYPDGLADHHGEAHRGVARHASVASILILGLLLALALSGMLGGGRSPTRVVDAPAARLAVTTPHIARNGIFFETRIFVTAHRPIAAPVIAIPATLWRDVTVNSQYPDPKEQGFKDGAFTFTYDALEPGETLELKFDGQINPPLTLGTAGTLRLADGTRPIAALPVAIRVLP